MDFVVLLAETESLYLAAEIATRRELAQRRYRRDALVRIRAATQAVTTLTIFKS